MSNYISFDGEATLEDLAKLSDAVSFKEYQFFFEGRADYLKSNDPERIIRSGLIEETGEVLETDPEDIAELSKEIGDIIFYLNASAQLSGLKFSNIFEQYGVTSLKGVQSQDLKRIIPIYSPDGERLDTQVDTTQRLIVDLLRVVDTMNPKTEQLWSHLGEKPETEEVIAGAFFSLGEYAEERGIGLNDSAKLSLKKIYSRVRNPHVIDQDRNGEMAGSVRERITLNPAIRRMRVATVINNADAFTGDST